MCSFNCDMYRDCKDQLLSCLDWFFISSFASMAYLPRWHPHIPTSCLQPRSTVASVAVGRVGRVVTRCAKMCQDTKSSPGCLNSIHDLNIAHLGTVCCICKTICSTEHNWNSHFLCCSVLVTGIQAMSWKIQIFCGIQPWGCWLQLRYSDCVGISYSLSCKAQHLFPNIHWAMCHPIEK